MSPTERCSKCNGRMIEGHLVDATFGGYLVPGWQEGKPKQGIMTGLKVRKHDLRDVATFRCDRCGYLENYAG